MRSLEITHRNLSRTYLVGTKQAISEGNEHTDDWTTVEMEKVEICKQTEIDGRVMQMTEPEVLNYEHSDLQNERTAMRHDIDMHEPTPRAKQTAV